jgi:hypothetical protein
MTKKGQWVKIKSSGSSLVFSNESVEESMNIATLRAKANLVEFLENEIKSSKSTESAMDSSTGEKAESNLVVKARESILSESKGVIKGAYVSERKISDDGKHVKVDVTIDRSIVDMVKKISVK